MSSSSTPELVTDQLIRATGLFIRRVRAEHPHELSIPQAQAMSRLLEAGPMTTADLARLEGVKPQSMGATLASLELDGLVAREPHPTDGRQMLLRLTPRGEKFRRDNKDAKRSWLLRAIGELPPEDRRTLAAAAELILGLAQQ